MFNKNLVTKLLSTAFITILFTSCLKDKGFDNQEYGMKDFEGNKIIEIPGDENHFTSFAFVFQDKDTTFDFIPVRLAANQVAAEDIKVTLSIASSDAMIADYNAEHGTSLVAYPSNIYSFPNGLIVTIPKGSREGYLKVTTNTSKFDPSSTYALGITVASVDNPAYKISGNFNSMIVAIAAKNKYDGNYSLRIKTTGWSAYGISENMPEEWPSNSDGTSIGLVTVGASSVKLFDYYAFGDYIQVAFTADNAAVTGFGTTAPKFTFDPVTNKLVSVVNDAVVDARNRQFRINPDPATNSRWESAGGTTTVYAAYILSQTGRPDMYIYDTLTLKGPRP
jgi:hypothetical protein